MRNFKVRHGATTHTKPSKKDRQRRIPVTENNQATWSLLAAAKALTNYMHQVGDDFQISSPLNDQVSLRIMRFLKRLSEKGKFSKNKIERICIANKESGIKLYHIVVDREIYTQMQKIGTPGGLQWDKPAHGYIYFSKVTIKDPESEQQKTVYLVPLKPEHNPTNVAFELNDIFSATSTVGKKTGYVGARICRPIFKVAENGCNFLMIDKANFPTYSAYMKRYVSDMSQLDEKNFPLDKKRQDEVDQEIAELLTKGDPAYEQLFGVNGRSFSQSQYSIEAAAKLKFKKKPNADDVFSAVLSFPDGCDDLESRNSFINSIMQSMLRYQRFEGDFAVTVSEDGSSLEMTATDLAVWQQDILKKLFEKNKGIPCESQPFSPSGGLYIHSSPSNSTTILARRLNEKCEKHDVDCVFLCYSRMIYTTSREFEKFCKAFNRAVYQKDSPLQESNDKAILKLSKLRHPPYKVAVDQVQALLDYLRKEYGESITKSLMDLSSAQIRIDEINSIFSSQAREKLTLKNAMLSQQKAFASQTKKIEETIERLKKEQADLIQQLGQMIELPVNDEKLTLEEISEKLIVLEKNEKDPQQLERIQDMSVMVERLGSIPTLLEKQEMELDKQKAEYSAVKEKMPKLVEPGRENKCRLKKIETTRIIETSKTIREVLPSSYRNFYDLIYDLLTAAYGKLCRDNGSFSLKELARILNFHGKNWTISSLFFVDEQGRLCCGTPKHHIRLYKEDKNKISESNRLIGSDKRSKTVERDVHWLSTALLTITSMMINHASAEIVSPDDFSNVNSGDDETHGDDGADDDSAASAMDVQDDGDELGGSRKRKRSPAEPADEDFSRPAKKPPHAVVNAVESFTSEMDTQHSDHDELEQHTERSDHLAVDSADDDSADDDSVASAMDVHDELDGSRKRKRSDDDTVDEQHQPQQPKQPIGLRRTANSQKRSRLNSIELLENSCLIAVQEARQWLCSAKSTMNDPKAGRELYYFNKSEKTISIPVHGLVAVFEGLPMSVVEADQKEIPITHRIGLGHAGRSFGMVIAKEPGEEYLLGLAMLANSADKTEYSPFELRPIHNRAGIQVGVGIFANQSVNILPGHAVVVRHKYGNKAASNIHGIAVKHAKGAASKAKRVLKQIPLSSLQEVGDLPNGVQFNQKSSSYHLSQGGIFQPKRQKIDHNTDFSSLPSLNRRH